MRILGRRDGIRSANLYAEQLDELDRLTEAWIAGHERNSEAGKKRLGTGHS
jgi:hypothetical protein